MALGGVTYSCQSGCIDMLSLADSDSVSMEYIHLHGNQAKLEAIEGELTLMLAFDKAVE
jgi:hypothetical protein